MSREEKRYLLHLVAFTLGLGLYLFVTLAKVEPVEKLELAKVGSQVSDQNRSPASLITTNPGLGLKKSIDLVQIDCQKSQKNVSLKLSQVRLSLQNCQGADLSITNTTNGSTAILIPTESGYITDYMQLSPGQNTIEVYKAEANGTTEKHTLVISSIE